jgi:tetratricopeptide (TPR) repeat protein
MSKLRVLLIAIFGCAALAIGSGAFDTLEARQKMADDQKTAAENSPENGVGNTSGSPANIENPKNAADWFKRGILLSVYGNAKAAIAAFKKVVELEPANSDAYFHLGIEYGTLGQFQQALTAIGKAFELNPQKPAFYYGRGWVLLLSGDRDKAIQDFKIAAQKGYPDAINYLRRQGIDPD